MVMLLRKVTEFCITIDMNTTDLFTAIPIQHLKLIQPLQRYFLIMLINMSMH